MIYKDTVGDYILNVKLGSLIPKDSANTDYANFRKQILADEAQLQDAEGNVMTAEQAQDFIKELP